MTEKQALNAILAAWNIGWEALHPGSGTPVDTAQPLCVPWTTRNEIGQTDQLGALGAWARIVVRHSSANQTTMGKAPIRRFERRGSIYVSLFGPVAPVDADAALVATLADDARKVLEGITLGGELVIGAGRTEEADEDGAWASSVVIFPFRYTETR